MPAVAQSQPAQLPASVPRRPLTRLDCRALTQAGLLDYERYELIAGELLRKMSKSRLHSFALLRLVAWLRLVFGQWHVEQEVSIDLTPTLDETNEPEPEAIVIRRSSQQLRLNSPSLADLLLVAEVSVSSADYDLGPKAALYASAGIADYWVLDMTNDRIVVHRDPVAGRYASIITYAADETVAPLAAPTHPTTLRQLLA